MWPAGGVEIAGGMTGAPRVIARRLAPGADVPNHPCWPVLLYPGVEAADSGPEPFLERFRAHGWGNAWCNGVFPFPHFHLDAHEVLACCAGRAEIRLGGVGGWTQVLTAGDAVLLPAGTGHCNLGASPDFAVVGAYPPGQSPDLRREPPPDPDSARARILALPRPARDPLLGEGGGIVDLWD